MVNPQPQLRRKVVPGYQLNEDIDRGYSEAVKGNQTNMALRYLEEILKRQDEQIQALAAEVKELREAAAKTAVKKETPKSAAPTPPASS